MLSKADMSKNEQIIERLKGTDEPYFVLRAQDKLAADVVEFYSDVARDAGCAPEFVARAHEIAQAMRSWPAKKLPD